MLDALYYLIIFGVPFVSYTLWRRFLRKRLGFLYLLLLTIACVWLASWPMLNTSLDPARDRDVAINGFISLGWLGPLVGCLPIVLLDGVISLLEWKRKRQNAKLAVSDSDPT